jgi:putative transposase
MSVLRRYYSDGSIYFVTTVTYHRLPILDKNAEIFRQSIDLTQKIIPFSIHAWVIMPDHVHMIIDPHDKDLSDIMKKIKMKFAGLYRAHQSIRGGRIWQHRFWDHVIRNQNDLNRCIDYIHYNPVKHGIVINLDDFPFSSFHEYLNAGYYQNDWGSKQAALFNDEFRE